MMENLSTRKIIRRYWQFARPNRRAYYLSCLIMFATLGTEAARPFILKKALDHISAGDSAGLGNAALVFLAILIIDYLLRGGFSYIFSLAILQTINRLRDRLFQHVLSMKMAFFDKEPVGRLLTRTINDCESLSETLRTGAATIVVDLLSVFVIFGVMFKLDLGLSLIMVVSAPLTWFFIRWCGSKLREKFLAVRKALAESNAYMAEGIAGIHILQLFGRQHTASDDFIQINKTYRQATIQSNVYDALLSAFVDGIAALVTAAILYVGFGMKFGLLEISTLIVYMSLVERIFIPIRDFSAKFATIQQALAAMQRILGLLEKSEHIEQGSHVLEGDQIPIAFKKVAFRYQSDGPRVLEDIDFQVEPGQVIALVGQTGSGKSTIGKLLIRAYDGYEGEILLGGRELKTLNYHSLRSKIAVVHQEVELFPATLRENITMFDPLITEERIWWAIRLVKAEHMIENLPEGLDFMVHENGDNLSSGQIQLIIFARALAHDAPIVLMDEATSSVDSVTEAWIQQAITQIFKHKTVLIVAHRLSTIAAADKILVLSEGRVIEEGTHQSLIEIEDGYYAMLVHSSELQSGHAEGVMV